MIGLRQKFACVFVLAGALGGCASGLTFDAPYGRVVTELRELYPDPRTGGAPRDGELRKGRRGREERQRRKEQERRDKERRATLAGSHRHVPVSLSITHAEPSSGRRSVIRIKAVGPKTIWKRQADITIRRLSEARTAVTVHCDYLRDGIFGYSRRRDRSYEHERLAEISARLEGQ